MLKQIIVADFYIYIYIVCACILLRYAQTHGHGDSEQVGVAFQTFCSTLLLGWHLTRPRSSMTVATVTIVTHSSVAGKVYVSHIVDFLRHTTCRSSEDSGLEELCNMLDPEHKDISIDLDTYHAIMKEWIDDCRNQGYEDIYRYPML